jgi:hypothetical protein
MKRDSPGLTHTGVDKDFAYDYMGSAEFEFGALGKSLKEMRVENSTEPYVIQSVKVEDHVAWYLGPLSRLDMASKFFTSEIPKASLAINHDLKERSYIQETYSGKEYYKKFIGWWCVDENRSFLLFLTEEHAKLFLKSL